MLRGRGLLLLLNIDQVDQVDGPVPAVDLENHELARLAAHDDEAAGDGLVHLDDSCDVVLAAL